MEENLLDKCRKEIDEVDHELILLILKRLKICKIVGDYKKEKNLPIYNEEREKAVIKKIINYKNLISEFEVSDSFINELWINIMSYSKKIQDLHLLVHLKRILPYISMNKMLKQYITGYIYFILFEKY